MGHMHLKSLPTKCTEKSQVVWPQWWKTLFIKIWVPASLEMLNSSDTVCISRQLLPCLSSYESSSGRTQAPCLQGHTCNKDNQRYKNLLAKERCWFRYTKARSWFCHTHLPAHIGQVETKCRHITFHLQTVPLNEDPTWDQQLFLQFSSAPSC